MTGRRPVGGGWRRAATSSVVVVLLVLAGCGEPADPEAIADVAGLTPENAGGLPEAASQLGDDVVALGEYCDRLGADDVSRIVGLDAAEYRWLDAQCAYELNGAQAEGYLFLAMTDSDGGAKSLRSLAASVDDEIAVDGVADDAVFREATTSLHVVDGERSFFAQLVVEPSPDRADALDQLTELVRTVVGER